MTERDVSERGSGGGRGGAFLLGVVVGAFLGVVFAPRNLRELAEAKVDGTEDADEDASSARRDLERRLAAARARRRSRPA